MSVRRIPTLFAWLVLLLALPALAAAGKYREIDWIELMPEEELRFWEQLGEVDHDADSFEEAIANQVTESVERSLDRRWQDLLTSTKVRTELNEARVRIPGFVVPLEFDDNFIVTEFFLVPFFGACIHVPPPPPNQIIHVTHERGFRLDDIYTPFWIEGQLFTRELENELAHSAYAIKAERIEIYRE